MTIPPQRLTAGRIVRQDLGVLWYLARSNDATTPLRRPSDPGDLLPATADNAPVWTDPPEFNFIDKHVHAKLKQLNLPPSDICTDAEFLRRASLDLCSTLPELREVTVFLASTAKDKRAKLIDILLQRVDFADSWTHQWMEELHVTRRTLGRR